MKKLTWITTIIIFAVAMSSSVSAQENIVKAYPLGFHVHTSGFNKAGYLLKFACFERVFTDKLSGQINLGILFNRTSTYYYTVSYTQFVIEPQIKFYLLDDAPHGLYVGGYYFLGIRSGGTLMGIGPNVGYQYFFLDDRLALDANIGVGVGFWVGSGVSGSVGFDMPFQVGAGWAF